MHGAWVKQSREDHIIVNILEHNPESPRHRYSPEIRRRIEEQQRATEVLVIVIVTIQR